MIEASASEKIFTNISIRNCSSSNENLIKIMTSLKTCFYFISFYNCTSGFLTLDNSSIILANSTFDNSLLNYTIKKSLISLENLNKNNITISKCFFTHIHSLSFGGVKFN